MINVIKKRLLSGGYRSRVLKRNIFFTFGIKCLSIAISFVMVPLTLNYISPVQYGFWLTLTSVVAWLSFLDIGFGNGLRNRLAGAIASNNSRSAQSLVSTTYFVLATLFFSVFVLFFIINYFLDWDIILNAPQSMASELSHLALVVVASFCLQMILKTLLIVFIAYLQPAKAALIEATGQLLTLILIAVLILFANNSLVAMAVVFGFSPVLVLAISTFYFFRTTFKDLTPRWTLISMDYSKEIISLGGKFFFIQIVAIVAYQTNNILITHIDGPEGVTIYSVGFKYLSIGSLIFGIIINTVWSSFTNAFILSDFNWMKSVLRKLEKAALLLSLLTFLLFVISHWVYIHWVGDSFRIPVSVSLVITVHVILVIWTTLYSILLNGMGKIRLQLYLSVFSLLFHLPLAYYLGMIFGIEGVILSSIITHIPSLFFLPFQVNLILSQRAKGIFAL